MDPDVAPLFYLFLNHPEVLDDLDATCNRAPTPVPGGYYASSSSSSSYPIFSKRKILSSIQQVGGFGNGYYAIPRQGGDKVIKQYASILNGIVNEFSPPSVGDIPTSHNYVQIIDCSLALYRKLQQHTVCQTPGSVDSGPFCTLYHLGFTSQDEQKKAASAAATAAVLASSASGSSQSPAVANNLKKPVRSSLYYFLPNTMLEFPFAWWHKCILLQGRTIATPSSSSDGGDSVIHCSQWRQDTIRADQMESLSSLYDEEDVRGLMLRVEGGVTSDVLRDAVSRLDQTLRLALSNFSMSGFRNEAERVKSQQKNGNSVFRGMVRTGAPWNFNMKCYSKARLPDTVDQFVRAGDSKGINCAHNMLMWYHNENINTTRYNANGKLVSLPQLGRPGMDPACFRFR